MKYSELELSTRIILKVIFAGLVLVFVWEIRDIILVLILALILASALDPLVNYLKGHKIPRAVSVIAVYILFIGLVVLFSYLFIPIILEQFKILLSNSPQYAASLQYKFGYFFGDVQISDYVVQALAGWTSGSTVVSSTFGIFNGFVGVISLLVISFYLIAEEKGMKTFLETLIPELHQEFVMGIMEKIQKKMGLWVLGQAILSFVMFLITWIGLLFLHVPYALVLAVIAGALEVVPYIGPFISAVPAVLIALLISPALAVAVAVLYLLLHELEGYILVPKIMEKTVGTSPLAVLLALLIGFKLAGVVGIIISVPLVGALTVVVNEFGSRKAA